MLDAPHMYARLETQIMRIIITSQEKRKCAVLQMQNMGRKTRLNSTTVRCISISSYAFGLMLSRCSVSVCQCGRSRV